MFDRIAYKKKAKMLMSTKGLILFFWVASIIPALLYAIPSWIIQSLEPGIIPLFLMLVMLFFLSLTAVGLPKLIMERCNGEEGDGFINTLFLINSRDKWNVALALLTTSLLITLILTPLIALVIFGVIFALTAAYSALSLSGIGFLYVACTLLPIMFMYIPITWILIEWGFVPFILADNPSLSGSTARKISSNMVKGYRMEIFKLLLSFIPWYVLSALTFQLASIYVTPYVYITRLVVYKQLKSKYAQKMTREKPPAEPVVPCDTVIDVESSDIAEVDATHIVDAQTSEEINEY